MEEKANMDGLEKFTTELEAVKVAWEQPHLTLEADYMWNLLKEVRGLFLGKAEDKKTMQISMLEMINKIDKLESDMPSEFIKSMIDDEFNAEEFVNKVCE